MEPLGDFVLYDSEGNLTEDKYLQGESSKNALVHFYCRTVVYCALRNSKGLKISKTTNKAILTISRRLR